MIASLQPSWCSLKAAVGRFERRVARLGPRWAFALLLVPALVLLPVKVAALFLLALGRVAAGLAILLVAKIVSTAAVARLFVLTQPQLMRLPWFARARRWWEAWRARRAA
jgi:hypothetical protein